MAVAAKIGAILAPGLVMQAVFMGGAYATGREIVQYFSRFDLIGGLYAIGFAFVAFLFTLIVTFEFARVSGAYDYRSFFRRLIGPGWWLFEVLTIVTMLLVLAVVASAAGEALARYSGWQHARLAGQVLVLVCVTVLAFFGREAVMKSLSGWALLTMVVFVVLAIAVLSDAHARIGPLPGAVLHPTLSEGVSGLQYALYCIGPAPLLLYCIRGLRSRVETVVSATVASILIVVPAVLIHFAIATGLPEILEQPLPIYFLIDRHMGPAFLGLYSLMLIGTLIDTSVGLIHGINERVDHYLVEYRGRALDRRGHAVVAIGFVVVSFVLSSWGIIALVDKGYGTIAWAFLFVYLLPLFTIGVWQLASRSRLRPAAHTYVSSP